MKKEEIGARICIYCGKPEYEIEKIRPACHYAGEKRGYHKVSNVEFSKTGLVYLKSESPKTGTDALASAWYL